MTFESLARFARTFNLPKSEWEEACADLCEEQDMPMPRREQLDQWWAEAAE